MANSNIKQLRAYLNNNKAKVYPIENDMLVSATDFVRNGYLKMLGVILQQPSEITEAQISLYKRMIAGAESENSAEDYLRMALEIEIDDFLNFTSEIKGLPIKYRFILDAMILTCVDEKNPEQVQLVAEFSEFLGIEKEELRYIATMAKALLCMDISAYVDADEVKTVTIPENMFFGYIRMLSKSCMLKNNSLTIFQPSCEEDVTVEKLEKIKSVETDGIKLVNVVVDLSEYELSFNDKKRVVLEGCKFTGGEKHSVLFKKCGEVIIRNCSFLNFSARTIQISDIGTFTLQNVTFNNCKYKHTSDRWNYWTNLGGVLYSSDIKSNGDILIDSCTFNSCGGVNSAYDYKSAFISNCVCNVKDSKFINCWHYYNSKNVDPEDNRRTMFAKGSKAIRCTYENSANFC